MEITEKERRDLVKKKEEIFRLTREILEIEDDREKVLEIKKRVTEILSLITTIAMFAEASERDKKFLERVAALLFMDMNVGRHSKVGIQLFQKLNYSVIM